MSQMPLETLEDHLPDVAHVLRILVADPGRSPYGIHDAFMAYDPDGTLETITVALETLEELGFAYRVAGEAWGGFWYATRAGAGLEDTDA